MRRFSQRNSLVTLNEINITPLLDLAFVLLIIFVITRPLLEQNIQVELPKDMGSPDLRNIDRRHIKMVEITPSGAYYLSGNLRTLAGLEQELVSAFRQDPKLIVDIRGDKRTEYNNVIAVINACTKNGITQYGLRTSPAEHR